MKTSKMTRVNVPSLASFHNDMKIYVKYQLFARFASCSSYFSENMIVAVVYYYYVQNKGSRSRLS